jgi:hypothetical protein
MSETLCKAQERLRVLYKKQETVDKDLYSQSFNIRDAEEVFRMASSNLEKQRKIRAIFQCEKAQINASIHELNHIVKKEIDGSYNNR